MSYNDEAAVMRYVKGCRAHDTSCHVVDRACLIVDNMIDMKHIVVMTDV